MKLTKNRIIRDQKHIGNERSPDVEDLEETLRWYEDQIDKYPKDTGLYFAKAAILAQNRRYEDSILTLDRIIELDPDNKKVWYIKANTLFVLKRNEEAIECYDKILEFDKNDEGVWYYKGEAQSGLERYREAIDSFEKAIELERNYIEAWLGRGNALRKLHPHPFEDDLEILDYERKKELGNALECFSKVNNLDPKCEKGWYGKGNVLYTLKRYEEALPCFDRCIEINPDFIRSWYDKGRTLRKLDREDEAIQAFEAVIGFSTNDPALKDAEDLCAKAYAFYELGRYSEALECFNTILIRFPGNHFAMAGKGEMLEKLGRKEEAVKCYKEVLESSSDKSSYWFRIGDLLNDIGNYNAALDSYNEAVQLVPECEDAWYRIGDLLEQKKDPEKAQECYSWIHKINPTNMKARDALFSFPENKGKNPKQFPEIIVENKVGTQKTKSPTLRRKQVNNPKKMINKLQEKEERKEDFIHREDELVTRSVSKLEEFIDQVDMSQNGNFSDVYDEINKNLGELVQIFDRQQTTSNNKNFNIITFPDENKGSIEKLIIMGRNYLEKKDFGNALNHINRALKLDPNHMDAWMAKGDVLLEMGKIDGTITSCKTELPSQINQINSEDDDDISMEEKLLEEFQNALLEFFKQIWKDDMITDGFNFECPKCGSKVDFNMKSLPILSKKDIEEED